MDSTCWWCGEGSVVADPDSGTLVCTSCGRVHDAGAAEFVHQASLTEEGRFDARAASFIHHSQSAYREQKLYAASAVITSTAAALGLAPGRVDEVLRMAKSATDGELAGPGTAFLLALAAACAFLVARSHRLPLSLAEAAEAASCTTTSLSDLVSRIASRLSLPPLPSFDYSAALERAVRGSHSISVAAGDKAEAILSQARFLLRCAAKWSLTTGRHPLPLVAGLIALAAHANGVTTVSVDDIAQDISAVPYTSHRRYKELVDALVCVARGLLPWGADVNAKNLLLNAPVLLRLMEMRSQSDRSEQFLEHLAPDMAAIVQSYSSVDEDDSKYLQLVPLDVSDLDFENSGQREKESEDLKISEGFLSDAYQNVLKRLAQIKKLGQEDGKGASKMKQWRKGLELDPWMDSLDDGWTKHMSLEELVDIDIGYDAPPPSFTAGIELQKRRRARIEAAKRRIDAIRKAPAAIAIVSQADLGSKDVCSPEKQFRKKQKRKRVDCRDLILHPNHLEDAPNCPDGGKKSRKRGCPDGGKKILKRDPFDGIDWEDCVIELLLLHGANEEEIEQGQYKRLLELRVFSAVSRSR